MNYIFIYNEIKVGKNDYNLYCYNYFTIIIIYSLNGSCILTVFNNKFNKNAQTISYPPNLNFLKIYTAKAGVHTLVT